MFTQVKKRRSLFYSHGESHTDPKKKCFRLQTNKKGPVCITPADYTKKKSAILSNTDQRDDLAYTRVYNNNTGNKLQKSKGKRDMPTKQMCFEFRFVGKCSLI